MMRVVLEKGSRNPDEVRVRPVMADPGWLVVGSVPSKGLGSPDRVNRGPVETATHGPVREEKWNQVPKSQSCGLAALSAKVADTSPRDRSASGAKPGLATSGRGGGSGRH